MQPFKVWFRDFRAKPTTFAYAGLWLIPLKLALTLMTIVIACQYIESEDRLSIIAMLSYPLLGLCIDLFLYGFRERIWPHAPEAARIPAQWKITPEQLQRYAQGLPKVRLLRTVAVVIIAPLLTVFDDAFSLESLSANFGGLFFLAALFDRCWLKHLKLKAPDLPKRLSRRHSNAWIDDDHDRVERLRQSDCTVPGTPAWFATQPRGPIKRSLDNWGNDSARLSNPTNPNHFGPNIWPPN